MGRKRKLTPTLRHHRASGRAFVRLDGRNIYLGPWGSGEAEAEHKRLCLDVLAGRPPAPKGKGGLKVAELLDRFRVHAVAYYRHPDGTPTSELACMREAVGPLADLYSDTPAAAFGPKALKAVREEMLSRGWARRTINARVNRIRRVFKWAVGEELVPGGLLEGLRAVAPLRRGRTEAADRGPVKPVDDLVVEATLRHLTPTVAAMVRVQRLTGMRPQDVRGMTPGEIDRGGETWVYQPGRHKTAYRGDARMIPIGPRARAVIEPLLAGKGPESPVFDPKQDRAERFAAKRKLRKSKVQPSQADRSRSEAQLTRKTPAFFTNRGYCSRIEIAARLAGVPHWSPNQLRHALATDIREKYGAEAAQQMLGHKHLRTTEIYAEKSASLAGRIARETG